MFDNTMKEDEPVGYAVSFEQHSDSDCQRNRQVRKGQVAGRELSGNSR